MIGKAILVAMALSVDSMAVSLSGSVSMGRPGWKKTASVALVLAVVQTVLLVAGYCAGEGVSVLICKYGPPTGFAMLLYVGASMIADAFKSEKEKDFGSVRKIFIAAVATSIDAMAAGCSFGLCNMPHKESATIAAFTFAATALFSVLGLVCGSRLGERFGKPAQIAAGLVLVAIGIELLVA